MTNFYILFGMREKMAFVDLCVLPVLTQNRNILDFLWFTDFKNGKLIRYFRRPQYAILSNMTHFDNYHSVWNERKMPFLKYTLFSLMFLNNSSSMWQNISECLKLSRLGFAIVCCYS